MSSYKNGDAKWFPVDVGVTPGKTYTYSHAYKSDVKTSLDIRYTLKNGAISFTSLSNSVEPSNKWKKDSRTFTVPKDVKSMTVMHLLKKPGILAVDDYSIVELPKIDNIPTVVSALPPPKEPVSKGIVASLSQRIFGGMRYISSDIISPIFSPVVTDPIVITPPSVVDIISPIISVISPLSTSTISGSLEIVASSSDNIGVHKIKFFVDDTQLGGDILIAPYLMTWNTASSTNGLHTMYAVASDLAGNVATSSLLTVTVENIAVPAVDVTSPVVEIISPTSSSTVTGTVLITASSSDNSEVAGGEILCGWRADWRRYSNIAICNNMEHSVINR